MKFDSKTKRPKYDVPREGKRKTNLRIDGCKRSLSIFLAAITVEPKREPLAKL